MNILGVEQKQPIPKLILDCLLNVCVVLVIFSVQQLLQLYVSQWGICNSSEWIGSIHAPFYVGDVTPAF